MAEVLISHSSHDGAAASALADDLRGNGVGSLFLDSDPESGLVAGMNWEDVLYDKLRRARVVLVLHSRHWRDSRWCFAELSHAKLLGRAVIPVCVDETPLDPSLSAFQAVRLAAPDAMRRILHGLRAAGLAPEPTSGPGADRPPFPGLASFQPEDAALYFGRGPEVSRIVDRIALLRLIGDRRFILLTGPSGSGKSSLLLAGVLPRLRSEPATWSVCTPVRAGAWLSGSLQAALDELGPIAGEATIVIPIDQVEEAFASPIAPAANPLLDDLLAVLGNPARRVLAVGTIRTDAVAALEDALESTGIRLELLHSDAIDHAGLVTAVAGPCELRGIDVEEGLAERIAEDCGDWRSLPALAYTLREMYERSRPPRRFTHALYDELGGVSRILDERMRVLTESSGTPPPDIRAAFFEMVAVADSGQFHRKPARRLELPAAALPLVDRLVAARVLVADIIDGEPAVELAHEALLRDWKTLADWLEQYRAFFEWRFRFRAAVGEFIRHGAILSAGGICEAESWRKAGLAQFDADGLRLLRASREQTRFYRVAMRVWMFLRVGGALAALWLLAGRIVATQTARPEYLNFPRSFAVANPRDMIVLVTVFAIAGLIAGLLAFGAHVRAAFTGTGVFATLLFASAVVGLPYDASAVALKSLPFAFAGPLALLLCVRASSRMTARKWLFASLLLLAALRLIGADFVYYEPNGYLDYGFLTPASNAWTAVAYACLTLPLAVGSLVAGAGQTAATYILLACGFAIALLGRPMDRRKRSLLSETLYTCGVGAYACLAVALLIALPPLANHQTRRAADVERAEEAAWSLPYPQNAFHRRAGRYARSVDELKRGGREWLAEATRYCEQYAVRERAELQRSGRGDIPVDQMEQSLSKELLDQDSFEDVIASPDRFKSVRVDFVRADSDGWAVRISGNIEPSVGCTIWDGKVPATVLATGFASARSIEDPRAVFLRSSTAGA